MLSNLAALQSMQSGGHGHAAHAMQRAASMPQPGVRHHPGLDLSSALLGGGGHHGFPGQQAQQQHDVLAGLGLQPASAAPQMQTAHSASAGFGSELDIASLQSMLAKQSLGHGGQPPASPPNGESAEH